MNAITVKLAGVSEFWVVSMTTRFASLEEVRRNAPDLLAAHVRRSWQLHLAGELVLAGALRDDPGVPVRTMGVLRSQKEAISFAEGDPFLLAGMISDWSVRPWANMFGGEPPAGMEAQLG